MQQKNVADVYREAAFDNAPPIKIVRLLYQGALRFLEQATHEEPGDTSSKYTYYILRADSIVAELRLSLAKEHAPKIADELEQLYLFVEGRLRAAIQEGDKTHIASARQVLVNLLDAWKQVEVTAKS